MSSIDILRDQYPGDNAWMNYAAAFKPSKLPSGEQIKAMVPQDDTLAETLIGIFGLEGASDWLEYKSGALDHHSPREILALFPDGVLIVRHALMRMPV